MSTLFSCSRTALTAAFFASTGFSALAQETISVTSDNFARAESDLYFSGVVANYGFGRFDHTRDPAPDGPMAAVLRLYLPQAAALNGSWTAPMIETLD